MANKISDHIFTWQNALFLSTCEKNKLKISWYQHSTIANKFNDHSPEASDGKSSNQFNPQGFHPDIEFNKDLLLDENSPINSTQKPRTGSSIDNGDNISEHDKFWQNCVHGITQFDLNSLDIGCKVKNICIKAIGFSFESSSSSLCQALRIPVILVRIEGMLSKSSKEKTLQCKFVLLGLSEETYNCKEYSRTLPQDSHFNPIKKHFQLIPLRLFVLQKDLISNTSQNENFVFLPDYGFIYVNSSTSNLALCYGLTESGNVTHIQQFSCADKEGKSTILLFRSFYCHKSQKCVLIVLLETVHEDDDHHCKSFVTLSFCQDKDKENLHSYQMEHLKPEAFFPQKFSEISLSFFIKSVIISGHEVLSSSLIMISTTGFALQFKDGEMTDYVQLINAIPNPPLLNAHVDIVDNESSASDRMSEHLTAVHINGGCDVINWSTRGVSTICSILF